MSPSTAASVVAGLDCSFEQQFLNYFPYRHRSIIKRFDASHWVSLSSRQRLTDQEILRALEGSDKAFRGLRWGDNTRFAVLDIDAGSEYHNSISLRRLLADLSDIGLTGANVYQSSSSGGWHVYVSFSRHEPAQEVERLLKSFLKIRGYQIRSGQLEIFPSGNGLRLPLQQGFAWLSASGSVAVRREELTVDQAICKFVLDVEYGASEWGYTKSRITEIIEQDRLERLKEAELERLLRISEIGFDDLFNSKLIQENYDKGKAFFREGLAKSGQRHEAVLCIEHYLWHGDPSIRLPSYPGRLNDTRRFEIIRSWLEREHNGFCNHINCGDWATVEEQIWRAVRWRAQIVPERTPYVLSSDKALDRIISLTKTTGRTWTPDDWRKANEKRRKTARAKIDQVVKQLIKGGQLVTIREVSRLSGCSRQTVSNNRDLLACGLGDLEPGGMGGSLVVSGQPGSSERLEEKKDIFPGSFGFEPGWCLTPCAEDLLRRRRTTDGMDLAVGSPPSPSSIKAQGSSTGLEGLRYACGEFSLSRLGSGQLRHAGRAPEDGREGLRFVSGLGEKDRVCDLNGNAPGGFRSNVFSLRGGILGGGNETAVPGAPGGLGSKLPAVDRSGDVEQELISDCLNPGAAVVSLRHQDEDISCCGKLEQTEAASARRKSPKQSALDSPVPDNRNG